jgi:hypothetical protein
MKKLILFFLIIPFISLGQEVLSPFKIEQGKLQWQKVYNSDLSVDQILSNASAKGVLHQVVKNENGFTANIQDLVLDYRALGISEWVMEIYISRSSLNAGVLIEVKDGRYRVTITNMILVQRYTDPLTKQGEKTPIEVFTGSKSIKKGFLKRPAQVMDYTFNNLFSPNQAEVDDNW